MPIAGAIAGVGSGAMIAEGTLMSPKGVALFYIQVAKGCYSATGSKRVACAAAFLSCGVALVPGAHQGPFIVACTATCRGVDKFKVS